MKKFENIYYIFLVEWKIIINFMEIKIKRL